MRALGIMVVLALASCGGSSPAPATPEPIESTAPPEPAPAGPPGQVPVTVTDDPSGATMGDYPVTVVAFADPPLRAGAPGVVRLEVSAPAATDLRDYTGFTPDFPQKLVIVAEGATLEPDTLRATATQPDADVTWGAWTVTYTLHVTPAAAGPLPMQATYSFSLCGVEMCTAARARLAWTVDVE